MEYLINRSIDNFSFDNNFVTNSVISKIIFNINGSRIVSPENKIKFTAYNNIINRSTNTNDSQIITNPLAATIIFCLTDLNKYDLILVNQALNYGIAPEKILILLLSSNIYDLDAFCKKTNIVREGCMKFLTLKKLSEIYKLQHNF